MQSIIATGAILAIISTFFVFETFAQESTHQSETVATAASSGTMAWGLLAAAIAFGLGALGAGIAISNVGAAAMGAVAEKPEVAGQALIFVALAEGLVVFGFIMGLLILGKV